MKRKIATFAVIGIVLAMLAGTMIACGPSYGRYHGYDRYGYNNGYNNDARQAYDLGYSRGLDHGYSDRRNGYNYDFDHDSSFRRGISRDRYINDRYRQGYERGYQAGYYGRR